MKTKQKFIGICLMAVLFVGTSSAIVATEPTEPVKTKVLPIHINSDIEMTTGGAITIVPPQQEIPTEPVLPPVEDIVKPPTVIQPPVIETTTGAAIQVKLVAFKDRVYNTITNQGIGDVKVTVLNSQDEYIKETITDQEGYFTLELPQGEYLLTFERKGFNPTKHSIKINE